VHGLYEGRRAPYRPRMTAPDVGRRRLPVAEFYVLLCTGLAVLVALGVVGPPALGALFILMIPAGIVPAAIVINVLVALEAVPAGIPGQVAFVLSVAVLAVLQAWMFRTIARNWRRTDVEMRPVPVTATPDTGA
jgi:hypothetical protein